MTQFTLRLAAFVLLVVGAASASSDCVQIAEAHQHVGSTRCVTGKIFNIKEGARGVTFLDFCENFDTCPFTVVVFADDLKHVGDVRRLTGREVQINGTVVDYDGRAEIVLRRPQQLGKDAALVPPLPRNYDVEQHGKFSPGKFRAPKQKKTNTHHKRGRGIDIEEDPSE
jgi:hypothetical protein